MNKKDTLLDHITRATIESGVFLNNTELEDITKELELKRSHCCRSTYIDRENNKGHFPFCDYTCDQCGNPCTVNPDVIVAK